MAAAVTAEAHCVGVCVVFGGGCCVVGTGVEGCDDAVDERREVWETDEVDSCIAQPRVRVGERSGEDGAIPFCFGVAPSLSAGVVGAAFSSTPDPFGISRDVGALFVPSRLPNRDSCGGGCCEVDEATPVLSDRAFGASLSVVGAAVMPPVSKVRRGGQRVEH